MCFICRAHESGLALLKLQRELEGTPAGAAHGPAIAKAAALCGEIVASARAGMLLVDMAEKPPKSFYGQEAITADEAFNYLATLLGEAGGEPGTRH